MNNLIRPQSWQPPAIGTRDGNWMWNGTNWVCDPDCGPGPGPPPVTVIPPCPPPYYPPPVTQPPWYPGANGGVSFGATPPPNPIRGAFWYDGISLWIFDGAAWDAIAGQAAMTGQATVAVGTTPPAAPIVGQLWFDGDALLVWDGYKWDVAGGGTATGGTAPANPQPGALWFNGSVLYVWDGNAWIPSSQTKSYVQATAPPSPNPGDLWFDGQVQRIWSGTAWVLVGPGATVGPVPTTTEVFSIIQSTNLSISAAAWTIVPFSTVPNIAQNVTFDPTSRKVTPTVPGVYLWSANSYGGTGSSGAFGGMLMKNDNGTFSGTQTDPILALVDSGGGSMAGWWSFNAMTKMNGTTDFVRLWSYNTGGFFYGTGFPCFTAWLLP